MSTKGTFLGIAAGLAAGIAIGILLAPRSGKETRERLKKKGREVKDEVEDLLDHGFEHWRNTRNTVVERAHMTAADIKDFLVFMATEGTDLKERIKQDIKGRPRGGSVTAASADQVINN